MKKKLLVFTLTSSLVLTPSLYYADEVEDNYSNTDQKVEAYISEKLSDDKLNGLKVYNDGNILSFSRKIKDKEGKDQLAFYNLDRRTGRFINLKDIFNQDLDYMNYLTEGLNIKPELVYENFYIKDNGDIVLIYKENDEIVERILDIDLIERFLLEGIVNRPKVVDKILDSKLKKNISLVAPELKGLNNDKFQTLINEKIETKIEEEYDLFKTEIKGKSDSEFRVNYNLNHIGEVLSLELRIYSRKPGETLGEHKSIYYNIDMEDGSKLELYDLFKDSSNYKKIINDKIKSYISGNKRYNFKGIEKNQDFYIDQQGNLIIAFPQASISKAEYGIEKFKIPMVDIKDILKDRYSDFGVFEMNKVKLGNKIIELNTPMFISEKGNLMLPLKEIMKELDYQINWNRNTRIVSLLKGDFNVGISIDSNKYILDDSFTVLNEKARSIKGESFVPRDFLEKILKYKTDSTDGVLEIKNI